MRNPEIARRPFTVLHEILVKKPGQDRRPHQRQHHDRKGPIESVSLREVSGDCTSTEHGHFRQAPCHTTADDRVGGPERNGRLRRKDRPNHRRGKSSACCRIVQILAGSLSGRFHSDERTVKCRRYVPASFESPAPVPRRLGVIPFHFRLMSSHRQQAVGRAWQTSVFSFGSLEMDAAFCRRSDIFEVFYAGLHHHLRHQRDEG